MSLWTRITEAISALAKGESLSDVLDRLRTPPERSVAFAIAVIALGAKLAKADGRVTRDEVTAFREVFTIPPEEEANAARVFNLARQDVAGYDAYARKIARMFQDDEQVLIDLMEGLFHVAMADGEYHDAEDAFLGDVARIFGLGDPCFRSLRARFVPGARRDPHEVLGLPPGATLEQARRAWREGVKQSHPDRMIARGVPEEAVKMAESRLRDLNAAWEEIRSGRAA